MSSPRVVDEPVAFVHRDATLVIDEEQKLILSVQCAEVVVVCSFHISLDAEHKL